MVGATERRLIVMPSIGSRPWSHLTAELFRCYARTCKADFKLETTLPSAEELTLPPLPDSPGRRNKPAYASKTFFAWKALAVDGYDRVLVVDDTCCVRSGTPDIFDLVPRGSCGGVGTKSNHAQKSFDAIERFRRETGEPPLELDPDQYVNTGVVLFGRGFAEAISPARIAAASQLLFSAFPNQTLAYYLLKRANVPVFVLPERFNAIPAQDVPFDKRGAITSILPYLDEDDFIYHLTGTFSQRDVILPELAWHLLNGFDPERARAIDWRSTPRARGHLIARARKALRHKARRLLGGLR